MSTPVPVGFDFVVLSRFVRERFSWRSVAFLPSPRWFAVGELLVLALESRSFY